MEISRDVALVALNMHQVRMASPLPAVCYTVARSRKASTGSFVAFHSSIGSAATGLEMCLQLVLLDL
jgi:hypothetical protein